MIGVEVSMVNRKYDARGILRFKRFLVCRRRHRLGFGNQF